MKILLITEFFPSNNRLVFTGGVEARTFYLARALGHEHQIKVISRQPNSVSASFFSLSSRLTFFFRAIIEGLQSEANIVEGSNWVTHIPAFIIARLKGVPAVAWYPDVFIGSWKEKFGILGIFGEITERIIIKLPWSHIIALSQQTKKKLIKSGISAKKISVVYAGVNQKEIHKIKAVKKQFPTICCISRLISYKRVADLIKAFKIVQTKMSNTRLVIIGAGPEENNLHKLAKRLSISQSIVWKKNLIRKTLLKTLKNSHVFCLPSTTEGFGLVTLETLAADVPYVNADIAINREVTHEGKGGLLFKPESPEDLAKKLIKLLTSKELYKSKLKEGQELLKFYSWEKSARETLKVYKTMLI